MARRRARKLPKELFKATIDNLSHEGHGIARIDGKATFIHGALPGEEVLFQYTEKKSQYDKGVCKEVVQASEKRVEPKCEHYAMCGGCSLQHMSPLQQIAHKQEMLKQDFIHTAKAEPEQWLEPLTDNPWHYRDKGRLSVRHVQKKNSVLIGFRERLNGRYITDIENCQILNKTVGFKISALKILIASLDSYEAIAQIEMAIGHQQNALILRHLEPLTPDDHLKLQAFAKEHDISWYLQPGGINTITPLDESQEQLYYMLDDNKLKMSFKPGDFTQVNAAINEKMVHQAVELLAINDQDIILDLFCGLGNFSLPMARRAKEVIGVEGCEKMVRQAGINASQNNISNTSFYQADLFQSIENKSWLSKGFNKLLIDPPRAGAKELCEQIELLPAERIVYVSCSPQTLARDTDILVNQKGYQLVAAGVMDMFPQTSHVESMALFTK